jgi:hypothetical protein
MTITVHLHLEGITTIETEGTTAVRRREGTTTNEIEGITASVHRHHEMITTIAAHRHRVIMIFVEVRRLFPGTRLRRATTTAREPSIRAVTMVSSSVLKVEPLNKSNTRPELMLRLCRIRRRWRFMARPMRLGAPLI